MNLLIVTGNLANEIELKKTASGVSVVSGAVAVQRAFKGPKGEKEVDYVSFVAWDKKADYLSRFAKKGDRLEMSGRLESRRYYDKDSRPCIVWELIVENVVSFSKKKTEESMAEPLTGDELPY